MPTDEFAHFPEAQQPVYDEVVRELTQGRKTSHWMWYVFPQLQGLGHSPMAVRFGLRDLEQARRYAAHPVLGQRLRQCTQLVLAIQDRDVSTIFGFPDDLKFCSCLTLFARAVPEENVFAAALDRFFNGQQDHRTLALLDRQSG